MALYACDEDDFIFAGSAEPFKEYWCLECFGTVKVRRGKDRFPHFYHVHASPSCRLYSKSEDHLVAQLQIQKLFPPGELQIERPFFQISRIADLCWEKEKIVFEIQCSKIEIPEAESRIRDYKTIHYDVIWLLDDRLFNRKLLRPTEEFLRSRASYFFNLKNSKYYDQFEIFADNQRVKKGKPLLISLQEPRPMKPLKDDQLPKQVLLRAENCSKYFLGDRIDKAFLPSFAFTMENWRVLEILLAKKLQKPSLWILWLSRHFLRPYLNLLNRIAAWMD